MREAVRPILGKIKPGRKIIFLINSKFPYKQMNYVSDSGKDRKSA